MVMFCVFSAGFGFLSSHSYVGVGRIMVFPLKDLMHPQYFLPLMYILFTQLLMVEDLKIEKNFILPLNASGIHNSAFQGKCHSLHSRSGHPSVI